MERSPYGQNQILGTYGNGTQSFPQEDGIARYFLLSKQAEGCCQSTIVNLSGILQDLWQFCQSAGIALPLDQLQQEHLVSYLVDLRHRDNLQCPGKRLAPSTINKHWRGISVFYNWLQDNRRISQNPLHGIRAPRPDRTLVQVFTETHIRKMLDLCPPDKVWGIRDRAIILSFLLTGIRRDEIARLQISDINFEEHFMKIFGKGRKERRVYLDTRLTSALIKWFMIRPATEHDNVFVSIGKKDSARPLQSDAFRQLITRLGKYADITDVRCSPHTFRHTFAINLLRAGKDVRFVQAVMGHDTLRSTEIYLRTLAQEDAMSFHQAAMPFKGWNL